MDGTERAREDIEAGLLHECARLVGVGVDGTGFLGGAPLGGFAALARPHGAELAFEAAIEAMAHSSSTSGVLKVYLIGFHGPVVHGSGEAHLERATHVRQVLAVIEVDAHHGARALGKRHHGGSHGVERHNALVRFGMGEDDGIARLLRCIDRSAQSLHARCVERGDRHVVLLGDSADIPKVYQHIQSFL